MQKLCRELSWKTERNFSTIAGMLILFSIVYLTNLQIKNLKSFGS